MALHPAFPKSPYEIPRHDQRWFPADETLCASAYEKLLPPLVAQIREQVSQWRAEGYPGASSTSRALLRWWFATPHAVEQADGSAEHVSVIGTPAFIEFVESIRSEGVEFEHKPMGGKGAGRADSLVVEVDADNPDKDLDALDIQLPKLARRFDRDYRDLAEIDPARFARAPLPLQPFSPEETRQIGFKTMLDDAIHHTVDLDNAGVADWRSVIAFFARQTMKALRLVGGYELLYPKVRDFVRDALFEHAPVNLEDPVVLRNLAEPAAARTVFDTFKAAINALTVRDRASSRIEDRIRLRDTRPFRMENRGYLPARKSIFNKVVPEAVGGGFELAFAKFLDDAPDVVAFAKNYLAVGFRIAYVRSDGDLSNYVPDFLVKTADGDVFVVEIKGRVDIDVPRKMQRLAQWCEDATAASRAEGGPAYRFVYVDQEGFGKYRPDRFAALATAFRDFHQAAP